MKASSFVRSSASVLGTGLTVAGGNALAAVPTEVSTALSDAKADGVTVAGLVLVVIIAIAAFKFIQRAL